jgi:PAS domain-containing protein
MDDRKKTKTQLLGELAALRQQVTTLQNLDATHTRWEADLQEARLDAESIVETVREPLVILDGDLRILAANRAFYQTFPVTPAERAIGWCR